MPELYGRAVTTGTVTVEHFDTIWGRINRQLTTVPAGAVDELLAVLDAAVARHVTDWLVTSPNPVSLSDLRDRVDEALLDIAPDLMDRTAEAEENTTTLHRRGNTFILTAGSQTTSAAIADALEEKARDRLADLRRERTKLDADDAAELPGLPTVSQVKGEVLLGLLGDSPERMKIRVNLFRGTVDGIHGIGAGYVGGVGWIDTISADKLESAATVVREITTDPEEYPTSDHYRFRFTDKLFLEGRDGHCRFPSCTVPASQCENDHIVSSPYTDPTSDGATHVSNGQKLCKPHHQAKTEGAWTCHTSDGGYTIHWTGPDGHSVTTLASGPLARFRGMSPEEVAAIATRDVPDIPALE
ncbi:MAG TPA: HNH endonuclease [Candidatus Corynebacterium avicola]|uniref:HNH endonuclease n=1 Tax=Candidatus Corynebacterium avicola TaxID=2838527 RepID=A0A9D1RS54_9CORY|nr:HNH endonuclease [Candidatus Corynebacterium avicola]